MTVRLTVVAATPADIEAVWDSLSATAGADRALVNIVDGELILTVDLRPRVDPVTVTVSVDTSAVEGAMAEAAEFARDLAGVTALPDEPEAGEELDPAAEPEPTPDPDDEGPADGAPVPFRRPGATPVPGEVARLRDNVLVELRASASGMSAEELAYELRADKAQVVSVCRALAADGLIRRAGVKGWKATSEQAAS